MARGKEGRLRFAPGWTATAGALVLAALGLGLAAWQLQRAEEKRVLENGYVDSMGGLPVAAGALTGGSADHFRRVRLEGRFDTARSFLVDNQIREGHPGYAVVTPFVDRSGLRVLVNRGWVAASVSRSVLPVIATPSDVVRTEAVVWPDTGLPPLLGDDIWAHGWPKRAQRLNVQRLGAEVGIDYPFVLRLEAGQPGAFRVSTVPPRLTAARHQGYAVQWAALTVLVTIGWLVLGLRRGRTGTP